MKKWNPREFKSLSQGNTASKWQSNLLQKDTLQSSLPAETKHRGTS